MSKNTLSITGIILISGLALALIFLTFADGAMDADAQSSDIAEKGYTEGSGGTAAGARISPNAAARDVVEGAAGLTGKRIGLGSEDFNRPNVTSGAMRIFYRFNGVRDDGKKGAADRKAATSIHCTNISSGLAQVEVQIYRWNGTDIYTATVSISANRSATFSTQNTSIYFEDLIVGGSPGTDTINQGSGRILSDTPEIICTAQVIDPLNFPPLFAVSLEMYKQ